VKAEEFRDTLRAVKVTSYDVLGYIVPGGFLVMALAGYEGLARQYAPTADLRLPVHTALSYMLSAREDSWAAGVVTLGAFVATLYVTGHVVASISALLVDRIYVEKAHGYPLQRILGVDTGATRDKYSENFYRAAFFWLNSYFLFRYLGLPSGVEIQKIVPQPLRQLVPWFLNKENFALAGTVSWWLLVSMLPVKALLSTQRARHDSSFASLLAGEAGQEVAKALAAFLAVLAAPARFVTRIAGTPLHTRRPVDSGTAEAFRTRLPKVVGVESQSSGAKAAMMTGTSAYWYAALHVRTQSPHLEVAAENWLRLYGFARNLGTAFYLAFLYCFICWRNQGGDFAFASPKSTETMFAIPLVFLAGAFTLLLRYYYLYADYYTKYLVRAFVYLTNRPAENEAGS
jgi:hypothetical protein